MDRLTFTNAIQSLKSAFKELFNHSSLSVEIYKPKGVDHQQTHSLDELYVVASGSGYFVNRNSRDKFEQGQVLFLPAGVVHRFEDFTENFSTWVIFYDPEGGEQSA